MPIIARVLLSIPLLLAASVSATPPPIKVITFNVGLVCVGPRCLLAGERTIERAAEIGRWLRKMDADIVFLQEVFQEADFVTIRETSGMPFGVYASPRSALALLSKFPIKSESYHPFRWQGSLKHDCKRLAARILTGIQQVAVFTAQGLEFVLANTHPLARHANVEGFLSPSDKITPERKVNIVEMWSHLQVLPSGSRVIFGGDFNMSQISDEYAFFSKVTGMTNVLQKTMGEGGGDWAKSCTFCAENPSVKAQGIPGEGILDHLWLTPEAFRILSAEIHPETDALSDHRAISATLELSLATLPTVAIKTPEIEPLLSYIESVPIHPFCWLAVPWGWTERAQTLEFLTTLSAIAGRRG